MSSERSSWSQTFFVLPIACVNKENNKCSSAVCGWPFLYQPINMKTTLAFIVFLSFFVVINARCRDQSGKNYCKERISKCKLFPFDLLMKKFCAKTCGYCSVSTVAPTSKPTRPRTTTRPQPPSTFPPTSKPTRPRTTPPIAGACGQTKISSSRVIAGKTARRGSWPWQVLMIYNRKPTCGGSIISPHWIVTAAHCVSRKSRGLFKIRVGEHDTTRKEGSEVEIKVSKIITHESWDVRSMNNDIALIKLEEPIKFNDYVQPVCLPQGDVPVGTNCYITGWGKIKHPGSMVPLLQQAVMPIVSNKVCEELNKNIIRVPITASMICAGSGGKAKQSGCHGDSGGPLVCEVGGKWEVHGAVSHGSPRCDSRETYTVFAKVKSFKNWIEYNMKT